MGDNITLFCNEIQSADDQISALVDGLLTPRAAGLTMSAADVRALMQVRALLPKVARMAEFLGSIGIEIVPDPSRVCGFFFDISRLELGEP
jgi:hypothetical protein